MTMRRIIEEITEDGGRQPAPMFDADLCPPWADLAEAVAGTVEGLEEMGCGVLVERQDGVEAVLLVEYDDGTTQYLAVTWR